MARTYEVYFVLSQFTRLTDRVTHGSLIAIPHMHSCSAVIKLMTIYATYADKEYVRIIRGLNILQNIELRMRYRIRYVWALHLIYVVCYFFILAAQCAADASQSRVYCQAVRCLNITSKQRPTSGSR